MAQFQWAGFERLQTRLRQIEHPNAAPLMAEWCKIIEDDNRKGVLAGLDKNGNPMIPVTYRPKADVARVTARQRNRGRSEFSGHGPAASGLHNNLTPAEYRRLSGPPLAPRGANSRVITNLQTGYGHDSTANVWFAEGVWFEVVSIRGVYFLPYHFHGAGRLPVRDLTGVRPQGRQKAVAAMVRWGRRLLAGLIGEVA